ncbi:MAG: DNA-directed RNA polymerase subunit beta' [Puniceicoccales bacterium]|jgi:DNA-directed RNA polymerase subunit beta'|nr:DNA-directed RNA polymerase subunit beta' [Puniceicoccales bacterium]
MSERLCFGKLKEAVSTPNFIEIQISSFREFLQADVPPAQRLNAGLQSAFIDSFPIESYDGRCKLEFISYRLAEPKFSEMFCLREGTTYGIGLYVTLRLTEEMASREEEVLFGEIPMMTERGSFVINGAERVVVSQLHRTSGVSFEAGEHASSKKLFTARIIPDRGTWIEMQFDQYDLIYVYLDRRRRRRKFLATTLLRALGYGSDMDLLNLFYDVSQTPIAKLLEAEDLSNYLLADDVIDARQGIVLARSYEMLTRTALQNFIQAGIGELRLANIAPDNGLLIRTLKRDTTRNVDEALYEIYMRLRPGEPPTVANAQALLRRLFRDSRRYDLGRVGRYKLNQRLGLNRDLDDRIISTDDIVATMKTLFQIKLGKQPLDDIDHLGNRRVRTVGELYTNQCRAGLSRMERHTRECMSLYDQSVDSITPQKLINPKLFLTTVRDFFARSQLSQLMDQINPLSELAHKRRISALGPGGLSRDRAGLDVRDVHPSHYARICPIESPEGPNIGLINALSSYARLNEFGFVEAPYVVVKKGKPTAEVVYLNADREGECKIAQANSSLDGSGKLKGPVTVRYRDLIVEVDPSEVTHMDVSSKQLVSATTSLIPFLEHDDTGRALMGANMQRQAVPLLTSEAPIVGTGIERKVAHDSRAIVVAKRDGIVAYVDARHIVVTADGKVPDGFRLGGWPSSDGDVYRLYKFMRTNAGTAFTQRPRVALGEKVSAGQLLADGASTENGELALGKNVLVAFMPWNGYNFEDAILLNERMLKDDVFTSLHIEVFEAVARDTKLGQEEITRDIPGVSDEAIANLNRDGVICIGSKVRPGDILVGKITPKSETDLAPEEKLLRAIFGEKAADVKDSSLLAPSGCYGLVMDVMTSGSSQKEQEKLSAIEIRRQIKKVQEDFRKQTDEIREGLTGALSDILLGEKIPLDITNGETGEIIIPANRKITKTLLRKLASIADKIYLDESPVKIKIDDIIANFQRKFVQFENEKRAQMQLAESGNYDEDGVIKSVRVYVATKRKIQVGDKMAGRHGNKGIVSKIVAEEDMPFLPDGTPIDIVLNPLGVSARMNVGQVLETQLGWACHQLGLKVATPVFDGASEAEILEKISEAGLPTFGKTYLFDGRTGERFDLKVCVGHMYMMKLNHLVADKIHARAVGPYSLITQQPLGGKAQYGGQRFGEMEVWAMQAYGAAYCLQELLTVKSDDVQGRTATYEAIIKGDRTLNAGVPQSFNVLVKELQALGLDVRLNRALSQPGDGGGAAANSTAAMEEREAKEILGIGQDNAFDSVSLSVASPDTIRSWSRGEIKNPETINYRTFRPEFGGLFCQRIFGPVRDYECACGKYKRLKYKDVLCERCGVEVIQSRVRRERMGHIELAVPVAHIWFFKNLPSRLAMLLDMCVRDLERVVYYEGYVVVDAGSTSLSAKQILSEVEYEKAREEFGDDAFVAKMGAGALREILASMDLAACVDELENGMRVTRSKQVKKKLARRLKLITAFMRSGMAPEWIILENLAVIPPDLRPLVPLDGGRFATSDLNDLYRRVINRNNRLKSLMQLKTPDVIIHNEMRMLQEAVDALLDNGRLSRPVQGTGNRPLKSLSDMLKGKQGRFRQNLLGKRVDYSGRSVIVIGPNLKLHQCGLPKKIALVLFEPFIIRRLKELGFVHTVWSARKLIEKQAPEIWDILEEVMRGHPVLLNRAPTLHRLSIQAFEPVLIEGEAIRLHPLVCTAFNADFDGDQMAVHVPLSIEAVMECKLLMMSTLNIFSPSSGKPIMTPSQDIVLGAYYLTVDPPVPSADNARVPLMQDMEEVLLAYGEKKLTKHSWINLRNPNYQRETRYGDPHRPLLRTTVGRVIFNSIFPEQMGFVNFAVAKVKLGELIMAAYRTIDRSALVDLLDRLKDLGFQMAMESGASIGIEDMIVPESKSRIVDAAQKRATDVNRQFARGIITEGERHNKVVDIWTSATDELANDVFSLLKTNAGRGELNPIYLMMDSGARGNRQQVRQLCGMRGLMARPSGEIIERPVIPSFREGLSVLDYFTSTHGARKGLADVALKTADAGYMTRKLCDVAMDCVITCADDGNRNGVWKQALMEGDQEIISLEDRITGRCSSDDIFNPHNPSELLVGSGQLITSDVAKRIQSLGVDRVKILSPLTHMGRCGIPANAYGIDLSTNRMAEAGMAVGIIAAQSIGEPGTQLTMKNFHTGGVANQMLKQPQYRARAAGRVRWDGLRHVQIADGAMIALNKTGSISVLDKANRELESFKIIVGSVLFVGDGDEVAQNQILAAWDPHHVPILSEKAGRVCFRDMIPGVTIRRDSDGGEGGTVVVIEHKDDLNPCIDIRDVEAECSIGSYSIPTGAQIAVRDGDVVDAGVLLAKTARSVSKTQDITGGLPRVAELFEVRRPKEVGEMVKISGIVSFGGTLRNKRRVIVADPDSGRKEEHLVPTSKQIIVQEGDFVSKGQLLSDGAVDPHEMLEILGVHATFEYLLCEIQKVYRTQGVTINDKHIEIILARMLRRVRIVSPGDAELLWGDQLDGYDLRRLNERIVDAGGQPAEAEPVLLGITKASLETNSFISAASFQETTRVLTDAATLGRTDKLSGFKENVIMGHPIPAGTGMPRYRNLKMALTVCEDEEYLVGPHTYGKGDLIEEWEESGGDLVEI